jgi:hypothetical protein
MPREQHPSKQQRASLQAKLPGIVGGGTVVTHKHNQPNEPEAFPNLNLSELERYAEKWANKLHLAKVSRIIMYRPKLNALGIRTRVENEKDRQPPIQYIVVFECQYDLKRISPETAALLEPADRTSPLYPAFLDDNFICVYKQPPAHEFSLDWHLETAATGYPPCELADLEFKWAWVLYPHLESGIVTGEIEAAFIPENVIDSPPPPVEPGFLKEGDTFRISFLGKTTSVSISKGLKYIHILISKPNKAFSAEELYRSVHWDSDGDLNGGKDPYRSDDYLSENTHQPILDKKYIEEIKKRLRDLCEEIAEAERNKDLARKSILSDEKDKLESEALSNISPNKRIKGFRTTETAKREGITRAINRSIKQLKEKEVTIGAHFDRSLRPVTEPYVYRPDSEFDWKTQ